jgi:hypothetical protein
VVEEPQAQLLLKIADLSRQRRLSNTQAHCSFRYAAQFSDCNKGSQAPGLHVRILCFAGIKSQHNYALDRSVLGAQGFATELSLSAHPLSDRMKIQL